MLLLVPFQSQSFDAFFYVFLDLVNFMLDSYAVKSFICMYFV